MDACVVCRGTSSPMVEKPLLVHIKEMVLCSRRRSDLGETKYKELAEMLSTLSEDDLKNIRYHSACRKLVVNKQHIKRVEDRANASNSITFPEPKRGRPPKTESETLVINRPKRLKTMPKSKVCIFKPDRCVTDSEEDLHQVITDNKGKALIGIKEETNDDSIRSKLSNLFDPGDAAAQEIWYHQSCFRSAERTCKLTRTNIDKNEQREKMVKAIADAQVCSYLRSELMSGNKSLTMNDLNDKFEAILELNDIHDKWHHKKHLKDVILKKIPEATFVKPPSKKSEVIIATRELDEAVEKHCDPTSTVENCLNVANILRQEILQTRSWKFSGINSLHDYKNPPLTRMFIEALLCGPYSLQLEGHRKEDAQSAVDMISQLLVHNTLSTRQTKHKSEESFKRVTETPLSVMLPLLTHQKTRSKDLTKLLTEVYVANTYSSMLHLEKRVHQAIISRIEDTRIGVCIPDFVKKDIPVFFAVDNIDFLEDTPCGKDTLHGTVIVMFQKDHSCSETSDTFNSPLHIPETIGTNPQHLKINYKQAPKISLKPIKFEQTQYKCENPINTDYNKIWVLSSYATNKIDETAEYHTLNDTSSSMENILSIMPSTSRPQLKKTAVMPTWGATRSLILRSEGKHIDVVHSEVVTPLFKSPPTDMTTLYTALSLTQEISSHVVGPQKQTIITLDMDLYERAIKLQQSGECPWILRPGELHVCLAALHALGKSLEGSGMDTLAIETGVYSSAAIRGIYSGKAFKRGVEYHIVNYMAILILQLEAIMGIMEPDMLQKCAKLKECLHTRSTDIHIAYKEVSVAYVDNVKENLEKMPYGELASWMKSYTQQVEVLLCIIKGCREGVHEEYLVSLNDQVKYFFQFDLYKYARMIPVYLAQMEELKAKDKQGWQTLQEGNFCVSKSSVLFTALFSDQALEQCIKDLKSVVIGLTQSHNSLDRMIATAPYFCKILNEWRNQLPNHSSVIKTEHHQLIGNAPIRQATNARKIINALLKHCGGNPFMNNTPLRSISSSVFIPDPAKTDILTGTQKGADLYEHFKKERLSQEGKGSVWDVMKKSKLKTFNTWMPKTTHKIADKVIKLREERSLLSRFLIIQNSRPELSLKKTIGHYELSVVPRSLFASDHTLLIPKDKSEIMAEIKRQVEDSRQGETNTTVTLKKVAIIDAMAEVQALKIEPCMKIFDELTKAFVSRIEKKLESYSEGRIIFDRYDVEDSLKSKTRSKRVSQSPIEFDIHKYMTLKHISMKDLLSSNKNKSSLTHEFGEALITKYRGSSKKVVVVKGTEASVNEGFQLSEAVKEHNHEEADTLIPLHVIDCLCDTTEKEVTVYSPDTDVLILLIDLVANDRAGPLTVVRFVNSSNNLNIPDIVRVIGKSKCRGLIGIHNFSGADWGGKFAGIGKRRWIQTYLGLPEDDPVIYFFCSLGTITISNELIDGELPRQVKQVEKFLCSLYAKGTSHIPDTRWELFRSKNKEGEQLPPTRAALLPHIQRVNYICSRDKSYIKAKQTIQPRENSGWQKTNESFHPTMSLNLPAPKAIMELVKCGCKKSCAKSNCSCRKNNLVCTPLCKCIDCENWSDYCIQDETDDQELDDRVDLE